MLFASNNQPKYAYGHPGSNMQNARMGKKSDVSSRLKELRERAGISVRKMAAESDMSHSTYQHYEDRHKGPFLPMDKAMRFANALSPYGINEWEVLALAGSIPGKFSPDDLAALYKLQQLLPQDLNRVLAYAEGLLAAREDRSSQDDQERNSIDENS